MRSRSPYMAAVMISILALTAVKASALQPIRISARKKTVSRRRSSIQDLPRGPSRSVTERICYEFRIQALTPDAATRLTAEWTIVVESPDGRLHNRGYGTAEVTLQLGREVTVTSTPVQVIGREWLAGPNPGKVEEKVTGYAIRLLRPDGSVVTEEYQPSTLRDFVDWSHAARRHEPRRRLLRRLQRLLSEPERPRP